MSDAAVAGPAPRPAGRRPSPSSAIALASPPARTLLVVVLMAAISQGHGTSVGPFLNEMAAAFHVSLGQMGQLAAAATIGGAVSSLGVLPFVSRLRPRAMLALVALGVAAGTVLTAVTPWFPALYVVRLVTGACNVLALAMGFVVLGRAYAAPAQHAVRVGVVLAASATGPTVGPPALRWIASWSSWQLAQLAYAAAAALVALVVLAAWRGLPAVTEGRATAA
ncbi:MAG: MFS transporter, partial [Actinobacteria bacterium]|nr:MFS transporter [Actinomycetota bacterium]